MGTAFRFRDFLKGCSGFSMFGIGGGMKAKRDHVEFKDGFRFVVVFGCWLITLSFK